MLLPREPDRPPRNPKRLTKDPNMPPRGSQEAPKRCPRASKRHLRHSREPRYPKMPPGSLQETPKRPSRCPQEAPKRLLRGAKGLAGSRVRVQGQGPGSRIQAPYRYSEVSGVKIRRPIGPGR